MLHIRREERAESSENADTRLNGLAEQRRNRRLVLGLKKDSTSARSAPFAVNLSDSPRDFGDLALSRFDFERDARAFCGRDGALDHRDDFIVRCGICHLLEHPTRCR
jgi:hypothetical protein